MNPKKPQKQKPAPKASVSIETGDAADRAFLEAMQAFDPASVPVKDTPDAAPLVRKRSQSGPGQPDDVIDLHGFTLKEALDIVQARLAAALARSTGIIHIRIITGKGRHSGEGGSVLAREVHADVRRRFHNHIQRIDEAPAAVMVGDLPVRGHFDVWLRS